MGDMQIRPFIPSDTDAVVSLWERCGLLRPWNDPRKDIERKAAVQPELFLVGELDGAIVASCMAGYDGHRGWIYYFAVDPEQHGRGLGSALLAHAESLLVAMGCPKVQLQVRPENRGVLDFYRSNGYEPYDSESAGKRLIVDS